MHLRMLLMLCLAAGGAGAGAPDPSLTIIPSSPLEGQEVEAVVATSSCTVLPPQATVLRSGSTVRVELEVPDVCSLPDVVNLRTYAIGTFTSGQYAVDLYYCGNPPPPLPRCSFVRSQLMTVQGIHRGVPSMETGSILVLILALMSLGNVQLARR